MSRFITVSFVHRLIIQHSRNLFSAAGLGLNKFEESQAQSLEQMRPFLDNFWERMRSIVEPTSGEIIFSQDIKNMAHLSQTDEHIELLVQLMKKFIHQNTALRYGSFLFGPVIYRLLHLKNKPDLALQCFKMDRLGDFFDQPASYQILFDLLYKNQMYQEILDAYDVVRERVSEVQKYPRNAVMLVFGACYKLNTPESWEYAIALWKACLLTGHMPLRRTVTFLAGLGLKQNQIDGAVEILATCPNESYHTVRNMHILALVRVNRVFEAIQLMKSFVNEDIPTPSRHTFNRETIDCLRDGILKINNPTLTLEFKRLKEILEKQDQITNDTLDNQLCMEIDGVADVEDKHIKDVKRYQRQKKATYIKHRPGLKDYL